MPVLGLIGSAAVMLGTLALMLIGGWEIQNGRDGVWLFRIGLTSFLAYWVGFFTGSHTSNWRQGSD